MRNYIIIFVALALSVSNLISFKTTKNLKVDISKETTPINSKLILEQSLNTCRIF